MSKKIPLIALIGLPNAGKSTMINRISGSKVAIVAKEAHTTRDLNYGEDYWEGLYMRFVDTGGLVPDANDKIQKAVQIRSWSAIAEADMLIWVIDRRQDPESIPEAIIQKIWKTGKPVMICINKVDDPNSDRDVSEYARLGGFGFVNVSSTTGYGLNTLMDQVVDKLLDMGFEKSEPEVLLSDQKKRERRKVPREVRRHKDGGYYIVRNEEGLFESIEESDTEETAQPEIIEKKIKNLVFDFWGVIFHEDTAKLAKKLGKKVPDGDQKVDELKNMLDELTARSVKKLSVESWVKRYEALTGLKPFDSDIWGDNFYLNDEVVDTIEFLAQNYNLYYLTNIDDYNFQKCRQADVFKYFKGGLASYKTGLEKPDPKIYKLLLNDYNLKPDETVFIDDREVNIKGSMEVGLHGILYNDEVNIEDKLLEIESDLEVRDLQNQKDQDYIPKIMLLGKPNVGKSSLFNAMMGREIQIVTDIAGTTLSVNDLLLERKIGENQLSKKYILLDSTGIRRPGQRTFGAESFATFRTVEAAHQADVICLILDGSEPLSHQDQVVAGIIKEAHKGLVVIANKDDLVDDEQRQKFVRDFYNKFNFLKLEKFIWVTAKESKPGELHEIWDSIDESLASREKVIEKTELRRLFNYLMKQKPPKKLRIKKKPVVYDLLYTKSKPPTFELLVKDRTTIHWSYLRFLENIIRKNFGFVGTEIVVKMTQIDRKKVLTD